MKEKLVKAEEIVGQRFHKSDCYYGLLVLSCYALLTKFENYIDIIDHRFQTTQFYIENEPIDKLLLRTGNTVMMNDINIKTLERVLGLSNSGNVFLLNKNQKLVRAKQGNGEVLCTITGDYNQDLNTLIHELSHLIKSFMNSIFIAGKDTAITRNGLSVIERVRVNGGYQVFEKNTILDEVVNVLQTSEMLKEIANLDQEMMDEEIQQVFQRLNLKTLGNETSGFAEEINLFMPLWNNEHFKEMIENNIVDGNLDKIEKDFNTAIGDLNIFRPFSDSFDIMYHSTGIEKQTRIDYVTSIIQLYNRMRPNPTFSKKKSFDKIY